MNAEYSKRYGAPIFLHFVLHPTSRVDQDRPTHSRVHFDMDNFDLPVPAPIIIAICAIVGIIVLLIAFVLLPRGFQNVGRKSLESKLLNHVIVTGGSSGIGLSVAEDLVKRKCKTVTLLARNQERMNEAKNKLESLAK